MLDPGGFGTVTITKAITIDGGPNAGGILNAGTNGVNINAGTTDIVVLRNLSIAGAGSGLNGVNIIQAGTVHVDNCAIYGQAQKGINATPTTALRLFVKDSVIRDNTNGANGGGVFLQPGVGGSVTAVLNNVELSRNTFGIRAEANTNTSARAILSFCILAMFSFQPLFLHCENQTSWYTQITLLAGKRTFLMKCPNNL